MAKNIKKCLICKQHIHIEIDDYVHLIDYLKGQFDCEGFYHTKCYVNQITLNNPAQVKAKKDAMKYAKVLINKISEQVMNDYDDNFNDKKLVKFS